MHEHTERVHSQKIYLSRVLQEICCQEVICGRLLALDQEIILLVFPLHIFCFGEVGSLLEIDVVLHYRADKLAFVDVSLLLELLYLFLCQLLVRCVLVLKHESVVFRSTFLLFLHSRHIVIILLVLFLITLFLVFFLSRIILLAQVLLLQNFTRVVEQFLVLLI